MENKNDIDVFKGCIEEYRKKEYIDLTQCGGLKIGNMMVRKLSISNIQKPLSGKGCIIQVMADKYLVNEDYEDVRQKLLEYQNFNIGLNMIYDQILADIKSAMIDKNNVKRDCLRSILSEIKNQTVNAGKEITDEICLNVLKKSVKQHSDSIDSFKAGKREDLALKEMEEMSYIQNYVPKMLDESQTLDVINKILSSGIDPLKKNFGAIMKQLSPNIDKKMASQLLKGILK